MTQLNATASGTRSRPSRRWTAAFSLFLLAPFLGEYVLGDLAFDSVTALAGFIPLALLYGGGAVVVREMAVRTKGGWGAVVLLAVAYGVIEEGLLTLSLFNPDWMGQGYGDYGGLPGLEGGLPWAVFVLTLHSLWSIVVPIVLVEVAFPAFRGRPWLGPGGTVLFGGCFALGSGALVIGNVGLVVSGGGFVPTGLQLGLTSVVALAFVVAGLLYRPRPKVDGPAPSPVNVLVATAVAGNAYHMLFGYGSSTGIPPWPVEVALAVAMLVGAGVTIGLLGRRRAWGMPHTYALAAGGVLTYCVQGVSVHWGLHGYSPLSIVVHAVVIAATLVLLTVLWRRAQHA